MCSKSGTTTQTQTIPPEVLARYKSINKYAEQVAKTPFQQYTGDFVANLTPTQLAGIKATNQYSQYAQPYYRNATQQLNQAQQQGMNRLNQSYNPLYEGMDAGEMMGNIARRQYMGAQGQAMPYYDAAAMGLGAALDFSQPYLGGATGAAYAGAEAITPEQLNIQGFMNPYTQAVAQTTQQALAQQQQEQAAGQIGNAIRSGGFGGDRAGLAAANLARQQQQGMAQAMAPIYQQGYSQALGSALSTAQANRAALQNLSSQLQGIGQQGYAQQMGGAQFAQQLGQGLYGMAMGTGQAMQGLGQQQFAQGLSSAQQLAAMAQQGYGMGSATAQQLAALGAGGQQAALQGAQAQLGAGTLAQQTKQAELTANYQQFLQERGYPFQVAQFLANIAMGTGALSGSTTTTTQPMPFFSDRRVKEDVKEIGETHDGQPIYSFKYKGDDATRIGLMAQDVEKKHPDAVYDMGGVKGVDYKQATEDSERPERYAGGLVPASMGGAVTEPGAYNRGGYSPGGLVDPNDLQAILAQQQQAFGPFGEGGIYGASHHEAPFSGAKGIVPQARLHTPKLREMGPAPRLPDSGVQQAVSAFDTAMGMKNRYETAKGLLSGKETPQKKMDEARPNLTTKEEVKDLAGPDIKAPSSEEDQGWIDWLREKTGLADGGVVPRHGYAAGSYVNPYDKAEEYFPEESLEKDKPELMKPGQAPTPTSQTGVGLGDLAKLAFLFLKDGGSVPRGRMANGGVYDPTLGRMVDATELTPEKIAELNKEDIYSRELQPAAAPRFRVFERIAREEGAKGVKPTELYRSPERSAMLDLTMPEGAPRAKPYSSGHNYRLSVDYSNTTPENYDAIRKAAAATGLTTGLDFKNVDPPHVQLGKGGYGGLFGKDVAIDEGFGQRSHSGVVPQEAIEAAYASAREGRPDLPATRSATASGSVSSGGESSGIMPSIRSYLAENQDWLGPLGAGLKGMVQSRSPFLGAAILEGVGSGLEAITPAQKALADIAQTKSITAQSLSTIPSRALVQDAKGRVIGVSVYVGGSLTPQTVSVEEFFRAQKENRPYRIAPVVEGVATQPSIQAPDLGVPPPPSVGGGVTPGAPSGTEEFTIPGQTPSTQAPAPQAPQPPAAIPTAGAGPIYKELTPQVQTLVKQNAENIWLTGTEDLNPEETNPFESQSAISKASQRDLTGRNALTAALSSLPREGSMLSPNKFTEAISKPVVQYVNGLLTNLNAGIKIADPSDLGKLDVIDKISRNLALQRTDAAGQRANAALIETLKAVPTSATTPEGAAQLIADLYVMQQRDIDLDRFYRKSREFAEKNNNLDVRQSQYIGRGLADEFSKNMESKYANEKKQIAELYNMPVTVTDPTTGETKTEYAISLIAKNGGVLPEKLKKLILSQGIDPEIFRYFSGR